MAKAERNLLACGLTTVTDAGLDWADILLLDSLHQTGDLKLRVVAMANPTRANLDSMVAHGGLRTEKLVAESFKFYMDGALGSRARRCFNRTTTDPVTGGCCCRTPTCTGRS